MYQVITISHQSVIIVVNYIRPEIAVGEMPEKQCDLSLRPNHINVKKVKHATNKLDITIICACKNPVKCSIDNIT